MRHLAVTRSHKLHSAHPEIDDEGGAPESKLPRFFAKHGVVGADPNKTKKDGAGRGNWGREGDEIEDYGYNVTRPRRRSNSSGHMGKDFKSKFETIDHEPVFDEAMHGVPPPLDEADEDNADSSSAAAAAPAEVGLVGVGTGAGAGAAAADEGDGLGEKESAASTSGGSIEDEDRAKKV